MLKPPKNLRNIEPKHCCATCKYGGFNDGCFKCQRPLSIGLDSGDSPLAYERTCDRWKAKS